MITYRRVWEMPNKYTFQMKNVKDFIRKNHREGATETCDPFCGTSTICKYRNDLALSGIDGLDFLKTFEPESIEELHFDPPYSPRQLKECYDSIGKHLSDTTSGYWAQVRDEIKRIMISGGIVMSFGWNSVGVRTKRKFQEVDGMLVCYVADYDEIDGQIISHGGNHNDTICKSEGKTMTLIAQALTMPYMQELSATTTTTPGDSTSGGGSVNGKDTVLFSKASDEWSTPAWLFDLLDKEFHFDCDAAATKENHRCEFYLGEDYANQREDATRIDWIHTMFQTGVSQHYCKTFWLNPPYSQIAAFMKKAYEESQKGARVVCLIPSRTDTKYFHDYCMKAQEIRFVKGRLKFGDSKNSAPFPSVIVIFKTKPLADFLENPYAPYIGKTIEQPKHCHADGLKRFEAADENDEQQAQKEK